MVTVCAPRPMVMSEVARGTADVGEIRTVGGRPSLQPPKPAASSSGRAMRPAHNSRGRGVAALCLQRLLDDQTSRQLHQLGTPVADDKPPSIRSESDSRVRIDAGTLFATGCLLAGADGNRHRLMNPQRGCTPTEISGNSRTSPRAWRRARRFRASAFRWNCNKAKNERTGQSR